MFRKKQQKSRTLMHLSLWVFKGLSGQRLDMLLKYTSLNQRRQL